MNIVIVGAGWAGLTAAVNCVQAGHQVTLLEAAPQAGGRARAVQMGNECLDNGQHLIIGAYTQLRGLLKQLAIEESHLLTRIPFQWHMHAPHLHVHFKFKPLAAPWHGLWASLSARGLSVLDKIAIMRCWSSLYRCGFQGLDKISVLAYLQRTGQRPRVIEMLWAPLCLAAMSTPIETASMAVFANVLQQSFVLSSKHSDLLLPKSHLSTVLPEQACCFIEKHGGKIHYRRRVQALLIQDHKVVGVKTPQGQVDADHVILAVSMRQGQSLLSEHSVLEATAAQMAALSPVNIITVYLRYNQGVNLPYPLLGVAGKNRLSQWLFDRAHCGQPHWLAVVITGEGEHNVLDNQTLVQRVQAEVMQQWPSLGQVAAHKVIREKYAAFACTPQGEQLRPDNITAVPGCFLAGDYTATGLPASLEGAVLSGARCAALIEHSKFMDGLHNDKISLSHVS